MAAAGGAQFLLFIGNADGAFIVLVLQSLAMTFCLTVDQNLIGHQIGTYTAVRLSAVTEDHLLCDGTGLGAAGTPIPRKSFEIINQLILGEWLDSKKELVQKIHCIHKLFVYISYRRK